MFPNFYKFVKVAQFYEDEKAIEIIIEAFNPKIKKSLMMTDTRNRDDLEQELHLKILEIIRRYDLNSTPGFFEYIQSAD